MAAVTFSTPIDQASINNPLAWKQATKKAFVDMLTVGTPVYIKSDDTFDICDGTANNAKAKFFGFTLAPVLAGQMVTARHSEHFAGITGLNPGSMIYLGAGPGVFSDVVTTGGLEPIGFQVDARHFIAFGPVRR